MTMIVKTMDGLFSHIIFFISNILKANMKYFFKKSTKAKTLWKITFVIWILYKELVLGNMTEVMILLSPCKGGGTL